MKMALGSSRCLPACMPISRFRIPLSRHLLLALVLSLLLHVLLLAGVRLKMLDLLPGHDIIDVVLVPPAKPKPVEKPPAAPSPAEAQKPQPVRPRPVPKQIQQKPVEPPPAPIQQAAEPLPVIPVQSAPPIVPVPQTVSE